jgi:hypothetical protein
MLRRRVIREALESGRPLTPEEVRALTAVVVAYETSGRLSLVLWPVLTVLLVVYALDQDGWARWLMLAVAAMYVVAWPILLRHRGRTVRRYREALARRGEGVPS